tara:strand:+ start:11692 stop:12021 length:330 start_codon:yes stop_codon:yes gene_type:complete
MKPICETNSYGSKYWTLNGLFHREDGPAIERFNGTKLWYLHGNLHREDGPACEYSDGSKAWYLNGLCHREDGPAVECSNGDKYWYYQSKFIDCKNNEEFLRMIKLMVFL